MKKSILIIILIIVVALLSSCSKEQRNAYSVSIPEETILTETIIYENTETEAWD